MHPNESLPFASFNRKFKIHAKVKLLSEGFVIFYLAIILETTERQMSQQCGVKAVCMKTPSDMGLFPFLLAVQECVFLGWDFNGKSGKSESCFYSEERFPPICCGWKEP